MSKSDIVEDVFLHLRLQSGFESQGAQHYNFLRKITRINVRLDLLCL